ncbi:spore cortex biosynthesis protein YabQ [Lachnospiraceae bacterium 29-84]
MMEVSTGILKETDVLIASFLTGMALLLAYDFIRVIRRLVPHRGWAVGAEDLLFWIGSAVALFAMLYRENSGYIRGFSIGGVSLGMLLYNVAFSPFVMMCSVWILEKTLFVTSRPLVWTARLLNRPARAVKRILKKILRFFQNQLKKLWKVVKIGICKR